jgi:hypothetical protein
LLPGAASSRRTVAAVTSTARDSWFVFVLADGLDYTSVSAELASLGSSAAPNDDSVLRADCVPWVISAQIDSQVSTTPAAAMI